MEKFDTKDRRLLAELDANSRASLSELAKKIHLSREAIKYRIERLQKKGYIRGFVTHIDYTQLGYDIYALYIRFGRMNEKKEKEVVDYLRNIPNSTWAASAGGGFDFILEFPARSIQEFKEQREDIITKCPGQLAKQEVAIFTFQQRLNRRHLYPIKQKIRSKKRKLTIIDEKDEKIIELLKNNSRMSIIEMSKKTKLPASTVAVRIRNLKKKGVICDFTIKIDPRKYDYHKFKTCIIMEKYSEKITRAIERYCEENPNVTYYVECVGRWDYELDFEAKDHEQYRKYMRQLKNLLGENLAGIETLELFTTYRFTF